LGTRRCGLLFYGLGFYGLSFYRLGGGRGFGRLRSFFEIFYCRLYFV
jgi:hypothetical protein